MKTIKKDIKLGGLLDFNHPEDAEHHVVSDYMLQKKVKKYSSVLGRKKDTTIFEFKCPKCGKIADCEQEHGDAYKCGNCGLNRQIFGNSLYLWMDYDFEINEPQTFIRARSEQPLKKDDVVQICGYEGDDIIVEKLNNPTVLIVDSDKPDKNGYSMIRIYSKNSKEHLTVLPNSLWDYDRSLCHSTNTKALKVKEIKDNMVYFYDEMAYKAYDIEYFDGKTFKPHKKEQ